MSKTAFQLRTDKTRSVAMNLSGTFPKLTDEERQKLVDAGQVSIFNSGDVIIAEGDSVDTLMFNKSGNIRVTRAFLDNLNAEFAGPLGPGEVVGEMSFMDGQGASASLIADGQTEILKIPRETVFSMINADNCFAARFYESLFLDLARKLRSTNQRVLPVAP
jgi:CRP/FNR family cyclic AMP-dependent transcriptional regulator